MQKFSEFASSSQFPGILVAHPFINGLQQYSFYVKQNGVNFPIPFPDKMVYKTSSKLKPEKLKDIRDLMQYVPESMKKLYKSLK